MGIKHLKNSTTETKIYKLNNHLQELDPVDFTPNAVDIRLGEVFEFTSDTVTLDGDNKHHRERKKIEPDADGFYTFREGYYPITLDGWIEVGEHEAGLCIPRSTLIRNGVTIYTAVYDSGYHGRMISAMYVAPGTVFRCRANERVCQYIVMDAETAYLYHGSYQEKKMAQ